MEPVKLLLDTESPIYDEMRDVLQENLNALETIKFKTTPGRIKIPTLGVEQIIEFVIENYDKLIPLVTAILNIINSILARKRHLAQKKVKKTQVITITIGENKLSLPAGKKAQKRFLESLEK